MLDLALAFLSGIVTACLILVVAACTMAYYSEPRPAPDAAPMPSTLVPTAWRDTVPELDAPDDTEPIAPAELPGGCDPCGEGPGYKQQ